MATVSIVDFLKSKGQDSSYSAREKLAAQNGISNYTGTAAQNTQLLSTLSSSSGNTSTSPSGGNSSVVFDGASGVINFNPKTIATLQDSIRKGQMSFDQAFGVLKELTKASGLNQNPNVVDTAFNNYADKLKPVLLNDLGSATLNGRTGAYDTAGRFIPGSTTFYSSNTSATKGTTDSSVSNVDTKYTSQLQAIIDAAGISEDQKKSLNDYFGIVAKGDAAQIQKMIGAYNAGIAFSSPVMKAQVALFTDALQRGMDATSGNLEADQQKYIAQRDKIVSDLTSASGQLDFLSQQELTNLKDSLDQNIATNADNLAASGRAASSVRVKSEGILNKNYQGLVETNTRTLGYRKAQNARDIAYANTSTSATLQQLQEKATQDRIASLRTAEQALGTKGLQDLGYTGADVLGNSGVPVGSSILEQANKDALSFATNF